MPGAPEHVRTARLVLRRPLRADGPAIFSRYASDAEVTRYLAWPRHQTLADTERFLDFSDAEWARCSCGPYLVLSRASGELLGATGLMLEEPGVAQTGYVLARDAWGRGYATECLRAMIDVARDLGVHHLRAQCHPDHQASVHVLEKCGFLPDRGGRAAQVFPNLEPGRQEVLTYSRAW